MSAQPRMSTQPPVREPDLTRRDEIAVSGAAMSNAPWRLAGAAGVVTAGADAALHVIFSLHPHVLSDISLGIVAFFAVAGAGALVRSRHGRALRWARTNPWRFAVLPGAAAAIIVFVLAVLTGSGLLGGAFTAVWHGAAAYGVTGLVGSVGRPRADKARS